MPCTKTRKVEHECDRDAEPHLLLVGKPAPLLPADRITFVDHGHIVCANRAAHKNQKMSQNRSWSLAKNHVHIILAGTCIYKGRDNQCGIEEFRLEDGGIEDIRDLFKGVQVGSRDITRTIVVQAEAK